VMRKSCTEPSEPVAGMRRGYRQVVS
jgi:hypothetical protein